MQVKDISVVVSVLSCHGLFVLSSEVDQSQRGNSSRRPADRCWTSNLFEHTLMLDLGLMIIFIDFMLTTWSLLSRHFKKLQVGIKRDVLFFAVTFISFETVDLLPVEISPFGFLLPGHLFLLSFLVSGFHMKFVDNDPVNKGSVLNGDGQ